MNAKRWRVVKNGRLPADAVFDALDLAEDYVARKTGATLATIRQDRAAGCPTADGYGNAEYDIEEIEEL